MIGKNNRVHVRILQKTLVARVAGEWINFVRFVQEQMGYDEE